MRLIGLLTGLFLTLWVAPAFGAETLLCDYAEKFKDGGSRDAGLELTLEGGEVTAISYHNGIASGEEGGGYICAFDASAYDGNSTWTRKKHQTFVELKGDRKSTFEIRKSKKGFMILFLEMSSEYCGFGAEFPEHILLDKGSKKCRVKFY